MIVLKRYASFTIAGLILAIFAATFSPSIRAQDNTMVGPEARSDQNDLKGVKIEEEAPPDDAVPPTTNNVITVGTYAFAAISGVVMEDMTTGTTQLVAPSTDDNNSVLFNIGFDFLFDGVNFTQFGANGNGFIRLGLAPTGGSFGNNIGTTTNAPKIMPYWDDLCTGSDGKVHFKTVGSSPNRKLVVEYQNMKITRNGTCTGAVGNGTFQLWLHETTGVIQFVYGALPAAAVADGGYSIGIQSGAATNFASVTTIAGTVAYGTANNAQMDAIIPTTSYVFTPNIPAAPSGLTFAPVTATSIQLNWTDNASNEAGYLVFKSLDGTNYSPMATLPANSVTATDTFLAPNTTYFYRVFAFSEGAFSPVLAGSQATATPGAVSSTVAGGLWSSPATWAGGVVPTASDNVTIVDGATVTIDTAAAALNVTVGGLPLGLNFAAENATEKAAGAPANLIFDSAVAQTLTVGINVTVNAGCSFRSADSGTVITHSLSLGGSLTNNGTLDFSTNGDTAAANISFVSPTSGTFGGSGATTDVRGITVNKGTSSATTLELNAANFTVAGLSTDPSPDGPGGFLTLTAGTFKISGTFTASFRTFGIAGYSIPAAAGFWLNNANYTVVGQNASPTGAGMLRVSDGTFNVGSSSGNSMAFQAGSNITVEGGAINAAGRFGVTTAATAITYNQSAGTVTVGTIGHSSTTLAGFDMGTSTASFVTITGGNIVVQNANGAASTPRDYRHQSGSAATTGGSASVTGGTVQLGNASTTTLQAFNVQGVLPDLIVTNNGGANTAAFGAVSNWNHLTRNITVQAGTTLNFGNAIFLMNGATLTNNGTITHNGASSRFVWFLAAAPQTYQGTGTVTAPMTSFEVQNGGTILDPGVSNIVVRRVILFVNGVTNANKLTLGNGDATVNPVQFGNTTTPTLAGGFDATPTFNLGTGGQTISYLRTGANRTTGPEINPGRTLVNMTYDDNEPNRSLTIADGNLTIGGTMALTNGTIVTGSNVLTHNGTVTRTTGSVNGTLNRSYAAAGSYTYHVSQNGYSPVAVAVTAVGTPPSTLSVSPTDAVLPGLAPATAVSRFWSLTEGGDLTATLNFTYLDADVNGTETNYKVFRRTGGVTAEVAGSTINDATNVATVTGITDFSDWGIGEALDAPVLTADIGGRLELSGGRGISIATIILTNPGGEVHRTQPNQFGYYRFLSVPTGVSYTVTVDSKRHSYNPNSQTFTLTVDNLAVNFTGTVILPLKGQETQKAIRKP